MNKPKVKVSGNAFCIECDANTDMDAVSELMSKAQDELADYISKLASELGVDCGVASDIWYLRTRSRWTQALEDQIIAAAKAGKPIDSVSICNGEWPPEK